MSTGNFVVGKMIQVKEEILAEIARVREDIEKLREELAIFGARS